MSEAFVRPNAPMTLVLLTYTAALEDVDAQMGAHVAWLREGFDQGLIVLAGRRDPRTGGVILFRGEADLVAKVAASDPFVTSGVATFEIIAFNASMAAPAIGELLG